MPSGRTEEVARRNRNIKRRYERGEKPAALAKRYGISRQQVHLVLSNPDSGVATAQPARQVVRPLVEKLPKSYKGIKHGTDEGYREELRRGLTTCDDCKEAHAVVAAEYRERRRLR